MNKVSTALIGSTGNIGKQAVTLAKENIDLFSIEGIASLNNVDLLAKQANLLKVKAAGICNLLKKETLVKKAFTSIKLFSGHNAVEDILDFLMPEIVFQVAGGYRAIEHSFAAIGRCKRMCIANKETLVCLGELFLDLAKKNKTEVIPVDSEHYSAMNTLNGLQTEKTHLNRLIITASGGPFFNVSPDKLHNITPQEALRHPVWNMGAMISINSATMMNKAFEIIEACRLFSLPPNKVDAIIHPQATVHSMIEEVDGSIKMHLSNPDMKSTLLGALSWPKKISSLKKIPVETLNKMSFHEIDHNRFPAINMAKKTIERGGLSSAAFNIANEEAVKAFLREKIRFTDIVDIAWQEAEKFSADNSFASLESFQLLHNEISNSFASRYE